MCPQHVLFECNQGNQKYQLRYRMISESEAASKDGIVFATVDGYKTRERAGNFEATVSDST